MNEKNEGMSWKTQVAFVNIAITSWTQTRWTGFAQNVPKNYCSRSLRQLLTLRIQLRSREVQFASLLTRASRYNWLACESGSTTIIGLSQSHSKKEIPDPRSFRDDIPGGARRGYKKRKKMYLTVLEKPAVFCWNLVAFIRTKSSRPQSFRGFRRLSISGFFGPHLGKSSA